MIRINLLATDRKAAKKRSGFSIAGQKLTITCSLILVVAALGVGWRYWSLKRQSATIDEQIAVAQQETMRLRNVISQVQQFEQRRAQLQQRVALIEQLRSEQKGPVHMLDQISRALPPMLWLTELRQGTMGNEVLIDGACMSQTGVSDFVANLENSGYFRKSVDIVSSTTLATGQPPGEMVRFSLRAEFQVPGQAARSPEARPGAAQAAGKATN
jgi:type IV pilus assembly protein PilN